MSYRITPVGTIMDPTALVDHINFLFGFTKHWLIFCLIFCFSKVLVDKIGTLFYKVQSGLCCLLYCTSGFFFQSFKTLYYECYLMIIQHNFYIFIQNLHIILFGFHFDPLGSSDFNHSHIATIMDAGNYPYTLNYLIRWCTERGGSG